MCLPIPKECLQFSPCVGVPQGPSHDPVSSCGAFCCSARDASVMAKAKANEGAQPPVEIPIIGDVDDWEADTIKALLDLPLGGECVFYIDSAGGSVYGALAVLTLMRHRRLKGT